MNDQQNKRLMRLFVITWLLLAVILVIFILQLMKGPDKEVNNYAGPKGDTGLQGIQGVQGQPGPMGLQGQVGQQGEAGKTIEREIIIEKTEPVKGDPGEKGDKGEQGDPGRSPELRKNEETGDVEWRMEGDTLWQTLLTKCDLEVCE